MDGYEIERGRGRPRKTIKKNLEINELDRDMINDRTLWRRSLDPCRQHYFVG
jgi:hypothetical protein